MKISDLLKKLAGLNPDEEIKPEDLTEVEEEAKDEVKEEVVEEVVEEKSEQPAQEEQEVKEEKVEEKTEEVEEPKEDSSAELEELKAKLAEAEAAKSEAESKIAELKMSNDELAKAKSEADAKAKLDKAVADGWLTPGQLKEAEDKESVFVTLAKEHPELFDRLALVMAPKVLKKPGVTEAPADQSTGMSEDELVERIKKLAAERGISYADAAQLI